MGHTILKNNLSALKLNDKLRIQEISYKINECC